MKFDIFCAAARKDGKEKIVTNVFPQMDVIKITEHVRMNHFSAFAKMDGLDLIVTAHDVQQVRPLFINILMQIYFR